MDGYLLKPIIDTIMSLKPIQDIAREDTMFAGHEQHYFGVGRSAIVIIAAALTAKMSYSGGEVPPDVILDFGAGYGRVARYLRVAFPQARLEVADYNASGPKWCVDHLGCFEMSSTIPERHYDLIWLGSVFTHLPSAVTKRLLNTLTKALRPLGVMIFTTGGRLGAAHLRGHLERKTDQLYSSYNMNDDEIESILSDLDDNDYGYADYHNQKGYGSALVKSGWIQKQMSKYNVIQLNAQEMAWDTHQDVYCYMRIESDFVSFTKNKGSYF
jgi:SAM-dependent methyltransferase